MAKLPTTWEQVCKINGIDPKVFPAITGVEKEFIDPLIADWQVMNLTKAINPKGWKADYSNSTQEKWRLWFYYDISVSAFVFNNAYYEYTHTSAGTGVRHVFKSKSLAEHAAKYFIGYYNRMLL